MKIKRKKELEWEARKMHKERCKIATRAGQNAGQEIRINVCTQIFFFIIR
jgi:hypothetical protein